MDQGGLIEFLAEYSSDPLAFVLAAFPWGEPGTELAEATGPREWQREVLGQVRSGLINFTDAVRIARTSGHGIGKSALISWLILWAMSTFEDTKGVVTANTETQLKTKTWAEVAKWYRLFIGRSLFEMTATGLFSVDPDHEKTWRLDMVPWSERRPEAFAGLHNIGKRILVLFDEGSSIDDVIWEVTEGALTDQHTQIVWAVFGNPTRNKGRFRECFEGGRFAHRWQSAAIDSRTVPGTNKTQFDQWVKDYGEDSDFVRVRVRGVFPRVDAESFIPYTIAVEATLRDIEPQFGHGIVLGVDVGRFGDDPSVIYPRKGRDGVTNPIEVYQGLDTMSLAAKVAAASIRYGSATVMIDAGGVGGGVADRLRQLRIPVLDVDFGSAADMQLDGVKYANKRAEIWGAMRDWLSRGRIPERVRGVDMSFVDELIAPNYGLNQREEIQLESKKDMRRRGVKSPNIADALACTFAYPMMEPTGRPLADEQPTIAPAWDPYERERILA